MDKEINPGETIIHNKNVETALNDDQVSMSTMQFSRRSLSTQVTITQRAYLEVFGLKNYPVGVELGEEEMRIGRGDDCGLKLPLHGVSRQHARVYFRNEEYYIEDLESTNGTYVNSIRVSRCVLRNNDQIEIGQAKIFFIEERMRRKSI